MGTGELATEEVERPARIDLRLNPGSGLVFQQLCAGRRRTDHPTFTRQRLGGFRRSSEGLSVVPLNPQGGRIINRSCPI